MLRKPSSALSEDASFWKHYVGTALFDTISKVQKTMQLQKDSVKRRTLSLLTLLINFLVEFSLKPKYVM